MSDFEIDKIKTRMLVYAIEQGIIDHIRPHVNLSVVEFEKLMFGDILQYFSSIKTNKNEDEIRSQLKHLSDMVELSTIRNSCSHSVRDFFIYYWYRVAAFAVDPRFKILGIANPSKALACVESGQISDPPEEWIERLNIPEITNNLPDVEQFDKTGLIGRAKEISSVINDIKVGRNNTIALVGPGGVGKTSLAVEIARKLKDKFLNKTNLDAIIYLTLKREFLTVEGIQRKNSEEIFTDIEQHFLDQLIDLYQIPDLNFISLKELLEKDNLLVILDNLEDLIAEGVDSYESFIEKFPPNWKVLITSRIPIDGAKNIPLTALSEGAIQDLARRYYNVVAGKQLDGDTLVKITNSCSGNPLALKLVIDRFNLGFTIEDSKKIALKDVLKFSFGSLIETLGPDDKKVLESIFIADTASRHLITELTKLSSDSIAEVVSRLQKTSLIERSQNDNGEIYKISSSVRDLLASSPLDFQYRTDYATAFSQFKLRENSSIKETLINISSFGSETPVEFQNNYREVPRIWSRNLRPSRTMQMPEYIRKQISNYDQNLTSTETEFKKYADYHRIRAQTRSLLQDMTGALNFAKLAFERAPNSLPVAHTLSILHLSDKNYKMSSEILWPFIEQFLEIINENKILEDMYDNWILKDSFSTFFKATTWGDGGKETIQLTENWKNSPHFLKGVLVFSRALALRRIHESARIESLERQKDLIEATKLLKYCINELDSNIMHLKNEVLNTFQAIHYTIEKNFIAEGIEQDLRGAYASILALKSRAEEKYEYNVDKSSSSFENIHEKKGVKVYSIKPNYVYARDEEGNKFYVPLAAFNSKFTITLKVDQKIWIWDFEDNEIQNDSRKVNNASLILA
jgi:hypothetical protein